MAYSVSTISFGIQMLVLGLLISAIFLKSQKKYRQHGVLMLFAVALHWISILIVMIPSFATFFSAPSTVHAAEPIEIATLVHVLAGLIAAVLGVWLVVFWRLRADLQTCFRKKRIMDVTFGLWSLAIVTGIVLYLAIIQLI